ncbi:hypothetical protein [Mycobacterium szulgai]|uniref:hypothetical protein n=1 Tax=Mycobacterium szulgai TaxID=1787 RepID=UPI0021F260A5|nr:hypothetical protein [Mycobacterium szulgai]MCV7074867.1 hypothetical protein [Mycobacterium szulgai]
MSDLTTDQRWLLYFMGGWQIRDSLIVTAWNRPPDAVHVGSVGSLAQKEARSG